MKKYTDIFLLLGSDLGDREGFLCYARKELTQKTGDIIACSAIYESEAWGFKSKNTFLNQVVLMESLLNPFEFLEKITDIENAAGRVRSGENYCSRTLDIDILFYNKMLVDEPNLKIPHPLIQHRRFCLLPMNELAPELIHPALNRTIRDLLEKCSDNPGINNCIP